jgi:lipopolysaccharide/colanic/teichoic acid biosynthesis glycosyltransferase
LTLKQVLTRRRGLILVITAPLFLLIAPSATSSGPVFFVQQRVGRGGRAFRCYKFRTMRHNSDDGPHREFARNFIRGNGNGNGHGAHGHGNGNGHHAEANGNGHATVPAAVQDDARPRITRWSNATPHQPGRAAQILNVLRGEMSLGHARRCCSAQTLSDWHRRRLTAKPDHGL